jgi:hypothetical protein
VAVDDRLARIAGKLAAARASPVAPAAFGAGAHGFVPGPPLPPEAVAGFEERHGIVLPASYRMFITRLGHGGAGPGYGLRPLPVACCAHTPTGHLARASPYRPGPRYVDDWELRFEQPWGGRVFMPGTVTVADHGCSLVTRLVVTGPARGRLINLDEEGPVGPYVVEDVDFLAWYERWLDEAVAGFDVGFFGERLPLGEPELLAVLAGDPSPDRRARAAASLLCAPRTGDRARQALTRAMNADTDASVRAAAWELLFPAGGTDADTVADTVADDIARHARAGPSRDLAALDVLRRLTPADILTGLAEPDPDRRRRAAYRLATPWRTAVGDRRDGGLDEAVGRLLRDPDPLLRCHGVSAVRNLDLAHRRAQVRAMEATETHPWARTLIRWCLAESPTAEPPTAVGTGAGYDGPPF